jgi:hypothetical protein
VNQNYGDTATLRNIVVRGRQITPIVICGIYMGNTSGAEPTQIGTGPDGTTCIYTAADIHIIM